MVVSCVAGVSTLTGNTFVGSAVSIYASSGIVSATSFYGDGSNLSGVTGTSGGALGFSTANSIGYGVTFLKFVRAGVSTLSAPHSGIATLTIVGGGGGGSASIGIGSTVGDAFLWYPVLVTFGITLNWVDYSSIIMMDLPVSGLMLSSIQYWYYYFRITKSKSRDCKLYLHL